MLLISATDVLKITHNLYLFFFYIFIESWPHNYSPHKKAIVPSGKDCHPLFVPWGWGIGNRESLATHPYLSEVVTDLWHPWMGATRVGKWQLECYNLEDLWRYNSPNGWQRSFCCSSAINCCQGKYALGTLVLAEEASSMALKDKPVGDVNTGPTRHGWLALAYKFIINF